VAPEIYWVKRVEPVRLALMARPRSGDWLPDEISGWRRAEVGTVVSLLEPHEVRELALSEEASLCEASGIEFLSFPIQDRGTPGSVRETAVLVDGIVSRLRNGTAVSVHCRAGIGRSGLIVGCVMLKLGVPFADIFPTLTQARGLPVPDTPGQLKWVENNGRA
jgi:protein-tyrosine phosphatase